MTRDEEIKYEANRRININTEHKFTSYLKFIEGAKWADKTMIEKVCKWLKENIDAYSTVTIKENSIPVIVLTEDFERAFKQAIN